MQVSGNLSKMKTDLANPVQYHLLLGETAVDMNALIGQKINLQFSGQIHCKICGRKTKKSFAQGFCYNHFLNAPENSPCIIKPELCEGHLGGGRDADWEAQHHVQPHVVYLALSSGLKVGVTRLDQVPTRWIDQGAWKAIVLANTPYRQLAGAIEVALKEHLSDKTHWQRMLKNELAVDIDLIAEKQRVGALLDSELQQYLSEEDKIWEIQYPVNQYPQKVKSLKLDKNPEISGVLQGIKGQYLIFEDGLVFNVRSHTSYEVALSA